jgi:hypothetical protein
MMAFYCYLLVEENLGAIQGKMRSIGRKIWKQKG